MFECILRLKYTRGQHSTCERDRSRRIYQNHSESKYLLELDVKIIKRKKITICKLY